MLLGMSEEDFDRKYNPAQLTAARNTPQNIIQNVSIHLPAQLPTSPESMIQLQGQPALLQLPAAPPAHQLPQNNVLSLQEKKIDQLTKLNHLKQSGGLTEEEYAEQKDIILRS
jgi:hypothetical protein